MEVQKQPHTQHTATQKHTNHQHNDNTKTRQPLNDTLLRLSDSDSSALEQPTPLQEMQLDDDLQMLINSSHKFSPSPSFKRTFLKQQQQQLHEQHEPQQLQPQQQANASDSDTTAADIAVIRSALRLLSDESTYAAPDALAAPLPDLHALGLPALNTCFSASPDSNFAVPFASSASPSAFTSAPAAADSPTPHFAALQRELRFLASHGAPDATRSLRQLQASAWMAANAVSAMCEKPEPKGADSKLEPKREPPPPPARRDAPPIHSSGTAASLNSKLAQVTSALAARPNGMGHTSANSTMGRPLNGQVIPEIAGLAAEAAAAARVAAAAAGGGGMNVLGAAGLGNRRKECANIAAANAAAAASRLIHAEAEASSIARGNTAKTTAINRKSWSEQEDATIRACVAAIGMRWRLIAPHLPGRSDDSVRNRWKRLKGEIDGHEPQSQRPPKQHRASDEGSHGAPVAKRARAHATTALGDHGDDHGGAFTGFPSEALDDDTAEEGVTRGADEAEQGKDDEARGPRVSWTSHEDDVIVNAVRELGPRWCAVAARLPSRTDQAIRNRWNRLQQRARVQARSMSVQQELFNAVPAPTR